MAKAKYNTIIWEDTTAGWAADTKVYARNNFLLDTTTGNLKVGNGVNVYSALPVIATNAAWANITDKPAIIAAGATKADARTAIDAADISHNHAIVEDATSGLAAAADLQALAIAISARIKAVEDRVSDLEPAG